MLTLDYNFIYIDHCYFFICSLLHCKKFENNLVKQAVIIISDWRIVTELWEVILLFKNVASHLYLYNPHFQCINILSYFIMLFYFLCYIQFYLYLIFLNHGFFYFWNREMNFSEKCRLQATNKSRVMSVTVWILWKYLYTKLVRRCNEFWAFFLRIFNFNWSFAIK